VVFFIHWRGSPPPIFRGAEATVFLWSSIVAWIRQAAYVRVLESSLFGSSVGILFSVRAHTFFFSLQLSGPPNPYWFRQIVWRVGNPSTDD